MPERHFAIAVLTNADRGTMAHTKIADAALDRLLGLPSSKPATISLDPNLLSKYAGRYSHNLAEYTLTAENGGFRLARVSINPFAHEKTTLDPLRLVPIDEQKFMVEAGIAEGSIADFILNDDGSIRFFRFGGRLAYRVRE